ncbi:MAG: hypothetical protein LUE08_06550, partial [Akkermansiaceae bacterium]|nr:hypothetical protein [Akkermansiaceae bacterium]
MKLHLPLKLRACLIAALIAVPALSYNAKATDYTAPSSDYGWSDNDITLTEIYNKLSGNTYTANQQTYTAYEVYDYAPGVRMATYNGTALEYDIAHQSYYYVDGEGKTQYVQTEGDGFAYVGTTVTDSANIVVAAAAAETSSNSYVSYGDGSTTLTASDTIEFQNSFYTGTSELSETYKTEFVGGNELNAANLAVNNENGGGVTTVVLEDAAINVTDGTSISSGSLLTVLDGDTSSLTDDEKTVLNLSGINSTSTTNWDDPNTVALGEVTGAGSLAIVGGKERSESTTDPSSGDITRAYDNAAGKDDKLDVSISSIGTSDSTFGNVSVANADVAVDSGIVNVTTLTLVNSETTVAEGGVSAYGINVNGESILTAEEGDITNYTSQGAGHVSIYGKVTAEAGDIVLTNGNEANGGGIHEGASVEASSDVVLSNVVTTSADLLKSGDDMTLSSASAVNSTEHAEVGDDLLAYGGSSINGSQVTVGDDVTITGDNPYSGVSGEASQLVNSTITVTGTGDDADADTQDITISDGSSMEDSHITGANGGILLDGSKTDADGHRTVTVGLGEAAAAGTMTNFIDGDTLVADANGALIADEGGQKSNLYKVLETAKENDADGKTLTSEQLAAADMTVGSSIENTTGEVTIKDAVVESTLITGGGSVHLGNTDDGTTAQEIVEQVKAQLGKDYTADISDLTGEFETQVDGVIIDVRGNLEVGANGLEYSTPEGQDKNDLTIDSTALTNSIILGITGQITVRDSVLDNDYIDGGNGLDIEDSVINDTDIVNLSADIKISGSSAIYSSSEQGFVLTTKGTADYTDEDTYTGGSILLDNTTLANGTIKSGVTAVLQADGSYIYEEIADGSLVEVSDTDGGAVTGELDGTTRLPYGQIRVTNSTLTDMAVTTAKGDIAIGGEETETSSTIAKSNNGYGYYRSFTATPALLTGASADSVVLNSIEVTTRPNINAQHQASDTGITLAIYNSAGELVAVSSNAVDLTSSNTNYTFTFDEVSLDSDETYTFTFLNSAGEAADVGLAINLNTEGASISNGSSTWSDYIPAITASGVDGGYGSEIYASEITTGDGGFTIENSLVSGDTVNGTYTRSSITATDDSTVKNSRITGTVLTVSGTDAELTITDASRIVGDVEIAVPQGTVTIEGESRIAMNGDAQGADKREAGIAAEDLQIVSQEGASGTLANGRIAVTGTTSITSGQTFTLDNVNSADGEDAGTLGSLREQDNGEGGSATLNVQGGSIVQSGTISRNDLENEFTTGGLDEYHSYFGHLNVGGDSQFTAAGQALVENYAEGGSIADTTGSKVVFEQDAWLRSASIDGTGSYEGSAAGQAGTVTSMQKDAHIGNLTLANGGVLDLVAGDEQNISGDQDSEKSYIAQIEDGADGTINIAGETLVTPELDSATLSLGLNNGVVILGEVAAEQGATVASAAGSVNPHVSLLEITNAVKTDSSAAVDRQTLQSTIKTTLSHVVVTPNSTSLGEAAAASVKTYYYVATASHVLADGESVNVYDPATGEVTTLTGEAAGSVSLAESSIVVKTDSYDTTTVHDASTDSDYTTGVTITASGADLTADESSFLSRITVPVVDEKGNYIYTEIDSAVYEGAVIVGQVYTSEELTYYPDAVVTDAEFAETTDGIASLTVANDMDSDSTYIRAYEIAQLDDAGNVQYENGQLAVDGESGYIAINGNLTGERNELVADNDVSIGGIVTNEDAGADYSNANTAVSRRGDVNIGSGGIVGSSNTLTADAGNVTVEGTISGSGNDLDAYAHIETADIVGDDNALTAATGHVYTGDITGDGNDLDAALADIGTGSITGGANTLDAGTSIAVEGTISGDANELTAGTTIDVTEGILGGEDGS